MQKALRGKSGDSARAKSPVESWFRFAAANFTYENSEHGAAVAMPRCWPTPPPSEKNKSLWKERTGMAP